MSGHNYYVHSEDAEKLQSLKEDYESLGRECLIEGTRLTVFSGKAPLPAKPKKYKKKPFRKPSRDE